MLTKIGWCLVLGLVIGVLFPSLVAAQGKVKFSGYVKNAEGKPPAEATVVNISGPLWQDRVRAEATTNSQGYYEVTIDEQKNYCIHVVPQDKKKLQGYTYNYELPISRDVERAGRTEIREDFTLERAGNIVLQGYLSDGSIARFGYLKAIPKHSINEIFYATDLRGICPVKASVDFPVFDDYAIAQGWKHELGIPSIIAPLNAPTVINVLWEVKGFGQVMLKADNEGKGYVTTPENDLLIIELNYELAKTQYRTLKNNLDASSAAGYTISESTRDVVSKAKGYLDQAAQATDRQRASFSQLSLNESLWAGEKLELEKATRNIEKYRKRDITVELRDEKGALIVGANVSYDQTEHSFQFALLNASDYQPEAAQLARAAGFNLAWLQFYGRGSPAKGKYDWASFDRTGVKEYRKLGYKLAVEALDALESGAHPVWWDDLSSFDELDAVVYEYVRAVAEHYKNDIEIWMVSNEPHIKITYGIPYKFYFSHDQAIRIIKTAIKGVKEVAPASSISVFMGFGIDGSYFLQKSEGDEITTHPIEFLELLNKDGVDYDSADLQFNYGGYTPGPEGEPWIIIAARDLASVAKQFEEYGSLAKPVGIELFNAPSASYPGAYGYWHKPWSEEVQTERVLDFYTIAFGNPHINKITYWNIMDFGESAVGLIDKHGNPKPAYYALKDLITKNWSTHGQQTTDASGRISFRGFLGAYNITVIGYQPQTINVTEAGPSTFALQLGATRKPTIQLTWPLVVSGILVIIFAAAIYLVLRQRKKAI